MMRIKLKNGAFSALFFFLVAFILSIPFHYYLLPSLGELLLPVTESISNTFIKGEYIPLYSDSATMQIWVGLLLVVSVGIGILVAIFTQKELSSAFSFLMYRISAYYLALGLFMYGFNKLFNYQFYFPEPNTLYTPLGYLSPDILYWSTMGTSYSYSVFAGLIELIPALLILFKRTRLLGALIAALVLVNVLMLNISFGITVLIQTCFFLLLTCILIYPHFNRLVAFFIKNQTAIPQHRKTEAPFTFYKRYLPITKTIVIGLILLESLYPYLKTGYFNGKNIPKPKMFGAYAVSNNPQKIKHLFFHSKGYLILQSDEDKFYDYELIWQQQELNLIDYKKDTLKLYLTQNDPQHFELNGNFYGAFVNWKLEKIVLEGLPIYQ